MRDNNRPVDAANEASSSEASMHCAIQGGRAMLALCLFLTIGAWGFLQPLSVLYLQASGLDSWQIGVVTGAGAGIAFLLQTFWGHLSDSWDKRRPLMFASAIGAGAAYLALRFVHSVWAFTLLTALVVNAILYLNAAVGTLSGRLASS